MVGNGDSQQRVEFTKEMKKEYKILVPNMLEIHFSLIMDIFRIYGYNVELLQNTGQAVVDKGLEYVHNDTCYPALLVIGQMMDALESGEYDVNKVALMVPQTGGGCRASNYIHLLRKALKNAGMKQVPVISLNMSGLEKNSGFKLKLSMLSKAISAIAYGDLIMLLSNQIKPYEIRTGECEALVKAWLNDLSKQFADGMGFAKSEFKSNLDKIAKDFSKISVERTPKVKVGVVGEIYAKFSKLANNNVEKFLYEQGCEVMLPGLLGFLIFKIDNRVEDVNLYGGNKIKRKIARFLANYVSNIESSVIDAVKPYNEFIAPSPYEKVKELVKNFIGYGNKMGEGWMLVAEMMELIDHGYENVVCAQPFGCLPNHIVGKGMIRKVKSIYPDANIVPIDYDPGATRVNQENRIKLMLSVAIDKKSQNN